MSKKNVEWEWKKLGDVCEIVSGRNQKAVEVPNGKYPIYGSGGEMGRANSFICPAGCTIVGRKGSINNPIFVNEPFWNVDTAFGFSPKKNCNSFFLFYFCKSFDFYSMNKGTTIPSLVKADLLEISIPIPPLDEQERIVKVLDDAFEKIDTIKNTAETNLQNAKDLFQTTLANELSITDEKIKQGWKSASVKSIGLTQTGNTPSTSDKNNYGDYIPFIKPGDVNIDGNGALNFQNEKLSKIGLSKGRLVKKGSTIMVCIGATIGKVGFVEQDISCNQQINSVTPTKNFEPKFIYYAMIEKNFQSEVLNNGKAAQATLPIINKTKWENLSISYPKELPIQKQIVAKLDSLSEKVKQLESNYKQVLADCDELKKSILKKAFNGEI